MHSKYKSYKIISKYVDSPEDHLIDFFHLPEVEDNTICEDNRYEFLNR